MPKSALAAAGDTGRPYLVDFGRGGGYVGTMGGRAPSVKADNKVSDRMPRGGWSGSWASIRDLEILRTVIEQGGVTSAARQLGISQPAVSQSLSALEERSGRSFFVRAGSQLTPTAEAMKLFEVSNGVFEGLSRIEEFRWLEPAQERLSIVAAPTIAHCLLPRVIARFRKAYPHISVSLDVQTSVDVLSTIASDQAQIGISEVPEGDWGVRKHPFRRSHLAVALRNDHRWANRDDIRAEELAGEPLIVLLKRNPFRTMLDRLLWRDGSLPDIVVETADSLSAVEHVEQGVGLAVVNPFPIMLTPRRRVCFKRLEPSLTYETCMLTNPGRLLAAGARQFMETLRHAQAPTNALSEQA